MKWVIMFILVVLLATAMQGQDSVATKVLSVRTIGDTTYYRVRLYDMRYTEQVIVKCCCRDKTIRQKGEMVMVAKKDLIFE